LLGFSTIKLLSFPLSHTVLYGRKSLYTVPCLRSRALSSTSRMFIYINYVEFSCKGYLSILPFVCLFNQFISVWVHRYLFYTLCYNLILPYLFCCSDSFALAIGSALSWVLLTYPHHCVWLFFFFNPLPLLSGTRRISRLILCIFCSSLRISYFSKKSWFLLLKMVLKPNLGSIVFTAEF